MSDKRMLVRRQILADLGEGRFELGSRLPGEEELVRRYGLSRATIREGIGMLVNEGVLARRRGSGTYVENLRPQRKTKTVAALVRCVRDSQNSQARIIAEVEDQLHHLGYSLILCNHDNNPDRMERYLAKLTEDDVAGVVFMPIVLPGFREFNLTCVERLEQADVPFVLIGSPVSLDTVTQFTYVSSDGFGGTRELVRHLVDLGHRRIAYIRGFSDDYSSVRRFDGYREEMQRSGLTIHDGYIKEIVPGPVESQGRSEMRELLSLSTPPTAVLCVHDLLAKNVIDEVTTLGVRVPQDLAVAGYDDDRVHSLTSRPTITTVHVPVADEGDMAVKLLFDKINGQSVGEQQIFLKTQLVVRGSTVA